MSIRIRRSIPLGKYAKVNISKSGASLSAHAGPVTVNSRGKESLHVAPGVTLQSGKGKSVDNAEPSSKLSVGNIVWLIHTLLACVAGILFVAMLIAGPSGFIAPFIGALILSIATWPFGTKPSN